MERSISLESFSGFYDSAFWANTDDWYYYWEDRLEHAGDWSLDYKNYVHDLSKEYTGFIERMYKQHIYKDISLTFEETTHPKEYNFYSDKIYATLKVPDKGKFFDRIRELMRKHYDSLKEVIYARHKSCDGFWSFMTPFIDDWFDKIEDESEMYLDCILYYLLEIELDSEESIDWHVYYDINLDVEYYMHPDTPEAKKEWEEYEYF